MSSGYLSRAGWSQTPVCSHRDWMQRRSKLSAVNTAQWALEERSVERSPHPAHRRASPATVPTISRRRDLPLAAAGERRARTYHT